MNIITEHEGDSDTNDNLTPRDNPEETVRLVTDKKFATFQTIALLKSIKILRMLPPNLNWIPLITTGVNYSLRDNNIYSNNSNDNCNLTFWDTNGSPNLGQTTSDLMLIYKKKKELVI